MASGIPRSTRDPSRTSTRSTTPSTRARTGAYPTGRKWGSAPAIRSGQRIRVSAASTSSATPAASCTLRRGRASSACFRAASAPIASTIGTWWYSWALRSATAVWFARIAATSRWVSRGEVGFSRLEGQHAEHPFFIAERQVEAAPKALGLEIGPEDGDEHPFGVRPRLLPVAEIERLTPAGGPFGARHQILQSGVLGVDRILARDRPDLALALVVQRDRAAVEVERAGGEVDDRLQHPVEIEGGGDLAADLEQEGEVMGPPLDGMGLGVAQSARGGGGEPFEQLAVVLVERSGAASLVDDLDRPDGDARALPSPWP